MDDKSTSEEALFEPPVPIDTRKPRLKRLKFRSYEQNKEFLFPESTEKYLPQFHIARLLSAIIDRVDISGIVKKYKGGGASAYHPRMMLKLWLLGFIYRIYSTRQLARATAEHLAFIWIAGGQRPDFRTLNNFRLYLEDDIKVVFKEIVTIAIQLKIIDGKDIFLDHSKMEANANRYKVTWRKNTDRYLARVEDELDRIFRHIKEVDEQEDRMLSTKVDLSDKNFNEAQVAEMVGEINKRLKSNTIDQEKGKTLKHEIKKIKKLSVKKEKYHKQKEILGNRNSYSNTDTDATAMRQKDGVSTKPGYNVGITTQNQVITNYDVTNTVSENTNFQSLITGSEENTGVTAENVIADSNYGNEENLQYLKDRKLNAFVSYATFRKEKSPTWLKAKIRIKDFLYDQDADQYRCPAGQFLTYKHDRVSTSVTGFNSTARVYQASALACAGCPLKSKCTEGNARSINVNTKLIALRDQARTRLLTRNGMRKYKQRSVENETIFGNTFYNKSRRRFCLHGLVKVNIEAGIVFTAQNISKIHKHVLNFQFKNKMNLLPMVAIG